MSRKDTIQSEATKALVDNNYRGTVVLDTGSGKAKIAIDCINQSKFNKILIVSPRTHLIDNWRKELVKWSNSSDVKIEISTIQTYYKKNKEQLSTFNLVIIDEIHFIGEKYFSFIKILNELETPIIGLTATPSEDDVFKRDVLYKTIPIIFRYSDAENDGVTNKCNYYLYEYELSDDYKVDVVTGKKSWKEGEKSRYLYLDNLFKECETKIKLHYFNLLKVNVLKRIERNKTLSLGKLNEEDIKFLEDSVSKDLDYFYLVTKPRYDYRDMSLELYYALKNCKGVNYSILGTGAIRYLSYPIPNDIKPVIARYNWAMNARKDLLWSLSSSSSIAVAIKNKILNSQITNKVLLFSELTTQTNKLSENIIHSNISNSTKETNALNKATLLKFNTGEIRDIASCQSLTLGLNLASVNWVIFESYSGSITNSKQKKGRANRLDINDVAHIVVIKAKNTQQEVWFEKAFSFVKEWIKIDNVNDLI